MLSSQTSSKTISSLKSKKVVGLYKQGRYPWDKHLKAVESFILMCQMHLWRPKWGPSLIPVFNTATEVLESRIKALLY